MTTGHVRTFTEAKSLLYSAIKAGAALEDASRYSPAKCGEPTFESTTDSYVVDVDADMFVHTVQTGCSEWVLWMENSHARGMNVPVVLTLCRACTRN